MSIMLIFKKMIEKHYTTEDFNETQMYKLTQEMDPTKFFIKQTQKNSLGSIK